MPFVPVGPPVAVPMLSGFDYVTVDSVRRRVYAAHTGSQALLVVDADTGAVVAQVRVGPLHGVAVDQDTGHVYTGNGAADSVSEIDPVAQKVLRRVALPGAIDAIAFDPGLHRIYADDGGAAHVYVIDSNGFKLIGTIDTPGEKLEYLAVDPATNDLYQNIADLGEFVVIDARKLRIKATVPTPEVGSNHPLVYDPEYHAIVVGGTQGLLASYDATGRQLGKVEMPKSIDQCDLDRPHHVIACAGSGAVTFVQIGPNGELSALGHVDAGRGAHTVAVDYQARRAWAVWNDKDTGDFVQGWSYAP